MIKLPFAINPCTFLPGAALMVAAGGLGWAIHDHGYDSGSGHVQAKWDTVKLANANEIIRLKGVIGHMEVLHHDETTRITDELFKANEAYTAAVVALNTRYIARLLDSEKRASIYQRMSEAGPVEQERLASHATKLDRSLEEGRRLVEEYRSTLEQRERELRLLGEQLISDRQLIGNPDEK